MKELKERLAAETAKLRALIAKKRGLSLADLDELDKINEELRPTSGRNWSIWVVEQRRPLNERKRKILDAGHERKQRMKNSEFNQLERDIEAQRAVIGVAEAAVDAVKQELKKLLMELR